MTPTNLRSNIHRWCCSNDVDFEICNLSGYLFELMDALDFTVGNMADNWPNPKPKKMQIGGSNTTVLALPLPPKELMLFRSAISLTGDAHCVTKALLTLKLGDLKSPVEKLHAELDKQRDLRNFLTHLNDRLIDRKTHGISGFTKTECGIEYTESASGNFHLILADNTVHYSDRGKAKKASVSRAFFIKIIMTNLELVKVFNTAADPQSFFAPNGFPPHR